MAALLGGSLSTAINAQTDFSSSSSETWPVFEQDSPNTELELGLRLTNSYQHTLGATDSAPGLMQLGVEQTVPNLEQQVFAVEVPFQLNAAQTSEPLLEGRFQRAELQQTLPSAAILVGAPLWGDAAGVSADLTAQVGVFDFKLGTYLIDVSGGNRVLSDDIGSGGLGLPVFSHNEDQRLESAGIDFVVRGGHQWAEGYNTDVAFGYSYNKVDFDGTTAVDNLRIPGLVGQQDLQGSYPSSRFTLSTNTLLAGSWNIMLRANYAEDTGSAGSLQPGRAVPVVYLDAELRYQLNDNTRFIFGAVSQFDDSGESFKQDNLTTKAGSNQSLIAPRNSANQEDAAWYLKAVYNF